ncbi:MAG TPA: hypothetical protein PLR18_02375 [bacterium]|nr:hypothetical protein [bacterium]
MTLILTALCKNGICVCADTRYQLKESNGSIKNVDGNDKIYKFNSNDIPLIIFNHGINNINGKDWKIFCSNYEKSFQLGNKKLKQIAEEFKSFVEQDIKKELQKNKIANTVGFVFCGKTIYDDDFDAYELWWGPEYQFISLEGEAIIKSGDGKECLAKYLEDNSALKKKDFWIFKSIYEVKQELEKLFSVAVREKKRLNRENFSDDYKMECIS